jgi:hypothetical protein
MRKKLSAEREHRKSNRSNYKAPSRKSLERPIRLAMCGWMVSLGQNFRQKGVHLDDRLKELMQDLGNAINESLSDSDRIAEAIGEIKRAGYDVFLVLEATIGFNKREEGEEEEENAPEAANELTAGQGEQTKMRGRNGKVSWTSQDQKFLRALKISLDEESK